jgi:alkyl hydroperoxide reductase subunit F
MKDLIIIGGGPAGITAGIYAARKKLDTLLIAKDFTGQVGLSSWIENYPGFKRARGMDLVKSFVEHLRSFDIEINSFESVVDIKKQENSFLVITDEGKYESKAIILATGGHPKKLNVENEDKFIGKGISYCVTCDANEYEGKEVAVVGGGNAGAEAALELTNFANKVYLLEVLDSLTADQILVDRIMDTDSIEIITSASIKSFEGSGKLERIKYIDSKEDKEKEISLDGCFIEIGSIPNSKFVEGLVELNRLGEVIVNPSTFETSIGGIFAAGDVVDFRDKQVVIATGQGAIATLSAFRYINNLQ